MKVLVLDSPVNPIQEIDMLKGNTIQGLYGVKASHESFWTLKAKVDLARFREPKKERKEDKMNPDKTTITFVMAAALVIAIAFFPRSIVEFFCGLGIAFLIEPFLDAPKNRKRDETK